MLVDTHAHLEAVDDLDGVFNRAKNFGVGKIITIGTSIETSKKVVKIAEEFSTDDLNIYATCGIHPKDGKGDIEKYGSSKNCINELRKILRYAQDDTIIVGIGECGLDYYVTGDMGQVTSNKEKEFQKNLFEEQIKLAAELNLPLSIHCRNAWSEIFNLLLKHNHYSSSESGDSRSSREVFSTSSNNKLRGVFHSWTGNWKAARKALDLGFYISFSGIVTFKNAKDIQEVAQKVPLDRMLIETDSPFLSPEPLRGKPNEPKNVKIVAQFIADLRGLPFDKIAEVTSRNAERLFRI